MILPVNNEEKQKLLEALTMEDKIEALESIMSYIHDFNITNRTAVALICTFVQNQKV